MGFDSHCHLHFEHFDNDLDSVIDRAARSGITRIMIPSVDIPTAERALSIASKRRGVWFSAGFHPEHLPVHGGEEQWAGMKRMLIEPEASAIGETGLDLYHRTFPLEDQIFWFRRHIELASATGYPLIVHSRNAEAEVLEQLPESSSFPVILHCWGGDCRLTEQAVKRGFYIGFGGPLTYRKNEEQRKVLASVPRNRILLETDSPFLPPEPHRGSRNEPAFAAVVALAIRETVFPGMSVEAVLHLLGLNALRAYRLHPMDRRADILYRWGDSLYVNLTSRCGNHCVFCIRRFEDGVGGYFLRHRTDPPESMVLAAVDAFPLEDFPELVFCGFGEPTLRPLLLQECAGRAKARGVRTRLNTNGLCTAFMDDEAVLRLLGTFDYVSVSLNASGEAEYNRICSPSSGGAWEHLMRFLRLLRKADIEARVTAVESSGADLERLRSFAARIGFPLLVRNG
jgi:TatD DNase family protein